MSKISKVLITTVRRLLRRLEKHERSSSSGARTLHGLPQQVLVHITHYLPAECNAALSLTCKHLYTLLRPSDGWDFKLDPHEILRALSQRVANRSDCIVCPECLQIHHNQDISHYGRQAAHLNRHDQLPACIRKDRFHLESSMPDLMSSTVFRMVMKKYQHAPNSRELLDKVAVKGALTFQPGNIIRYAKSEYKIVHGNLLYRWQSMSVSEWRFESISGDHSFFRNRIDAYVHVCPHISVLKKDRLESNDQIHGCQHCRTEYRIGAAMNISWGVVTIFECWKNFGPDPSSDAWKDHLSIDARELCNFRASSTSQGEPSYTVLYPRIASAFGDSSNMKKFAWTSPQERLAIFHQRLPASDVYHQKLTQQYLPYRELRHAEVICKRPESLPPYDDKWLGE